MMMMILMMHKNVSGNVNLDFDRNIVAYKATTVTTISKYRWSQ